MEASVVSMVMSASLIMEKIDSLFKFTDTNRQAQSTIATALPTAPFNIQPSDGSDIVPAKALPVRASDKGVKVARDLY